MYLFAIALTNFATIPSKTTLLQRLLVTIARNDNIAAKTVCGVTINRIIRLA